MTETATQSQRTLPPDIADFCRRAVEALRAKLPVREVWLFGSHADGRAKKHSDMDLFVVLADDHGLKKSTQGLRGRDRPNQNAAEDRRAYSRRKLLAPSSVSEFRALVGRRSQGNLSVRERRIFS